MNDLRLLQQSMLTKVSREKAENTFKMQAKEVEKKQQDKLKGIDTVEEQSRNYVMERNNSEHEEQRLYKHKRSQHCENP